MILITTTSCGFVV